ncbi:two-component response regulator ARR2 [Striga asiatica]|uniref:Two-component response regulator ARR2 n=1 Tax=Striga asiatica TaxID=4170 RepID=A0A5A7PII9_STRAF|nr:two-component response regulator ARR2 [Striga asiatica]
MAAPIASSSWRLSFACANTKDGFVLLKEVSLRMDIPVWDDSKERLLKGIVNGACDFLIKPVRVKELKNIWQHVVRKKLRKNKNVDNNKIVNHVVGKSHVEMKEASNSNSVCFNENPNNDKRHTHDEVSLKQKKPRVVWSQELHRNFFGVVDQLGVDKIQNAPEKSKREAAGPQQANNTPLLSGVPSFNSTAYNNNYDNQHMNIIRREFPKDPSSVGSISMHVIQNNSSGHGQGQASHQSL